MTRYTPVVFFVLACLLGSCSGGKTAVSTDHNKDSIKHIQWASYTYKFYLEAFGLEDRPHDQIWIDTTGQVTFDTDQHMHSGEWKHLRGYAYLEPKDEDTLLGFINDTSLLYIEESDVTPECPKGDQYVLQYHRSDVKKHLAIHTNFCATEFNLLTGQTRKTFPQFLKFLSRIRDRYRVGLMDPAANDMRH